MFQVVGRLFVNCSIISFLFFLSSYSICDVVFAFGKSTQFTVMTSDGFHSLNLTLWTNHRENTLEMFVLRIHLVLARIWNETFVYIKYIYFPIHSQTIRFCDRWRTVVRVKYQMTRSQCNNSRHESAKFSNGRNRYNCITNFSYWRFGWVRLYSINIPKWANETFENILFTQYSFKFGYELAKITQKRETERESESF